jgi:putative dimethyl sulfoxide reductase chaperone
MQKQISKDISKYQHVRGDVYFLLSRLFLEEPEQGFMNRLADAEFFQEFGVAENDEIIEGTKLLQEFLEGYLRGEPHQGIEELKVEYTRLLIGTDTFPSPPWESVYCSEDRMIFGKETLEVRNDYGKFGLSFIRKTNEPDDHVGLELEFLYHLCKETEKAIGEDDWLRVISILEAQRDFFDKHVNVWTPQFFNDLFENATSLYYRGVAKFTSGFLKWDYRLLLELIKELGEVDSKLSRSN